jgi:multidrug efflux pump
VNNIIDFAITKYKSTILALICIFVIGINSYSSIPKESNPDIKIPLINVSVFHDGISPEDSEKLLVKPLEKEIRNVKNIKKINATASENFASVSIEFLAGVDVGQSFADIRDAVSRAKAELPNDAEEPVVKEFSMADEQPVINIIITGDADERALVKIADTLEEKIEGIPEVLKVDIAGKKEEMIEILISPEKLETYNLNQVDIFNLFSSNNLLIAAGTLDNGHGKYSFKIPGTIDNLKDILEMPLKIKGNIVTTFEDIAEIRRIYKEPNSFSRVNNDRAISLAVKKRAGENIINTIQKTKEIVDTLKKHLPDTIKINYINDQSKNIEDMLQDLENNIITSIVLVMLVIIASLGFRSSILVSLAIPGAFFMGLTILYLMGVTLNMVVLFSLIMSIGMLVDGAIVVSEYADKLITSGKNKKDAFTIASKRMTMPIISSTCTTLAAFVPLLFWPSTTGQFMSYLPLTLIITLSCSLLMALIFIPTIGTKIAKNKKASKKELHNLKQMKNKTYENIKGSEGIYYRILNNSVSYPKRTLLGMFLLSFLIMQSYISSGLGSVFFPDVNTEGTTVVVKVKGDLSIYEKDNLVKEIESKLEIFKPEVDYFYSRTINNGETIGKIKLTLKDWQERRHSSDINESLRDFFKDNAGVIIEVNEQRNGPTTGKPLQLNIASNNKEKLYNIVEKLSNKFKETNYLIEVENNIPTDGLQWNILVNRKKASQYEASVASIGSSIQMITNGVKISDYRPDDIDDEIDIRIRYPQKYRNIDTFESLKVNTKDGLIPLNYFVKKEFSPKVSKIYRKDGMETLTIASNIKKGILLNEKIPEIKLILKDIIGNDPEINISFAGDQEEQMQTMTFLKNAFITAIFCMFFILLMQFNSIYQSIIVLTSIVFSTIGSLGLLFLLQEPFGIVMGGIGMISLAGIVVNNNIVLIDTFNEKIKNGLNHKDAVIETGIERLRPVFLTTFTTILGLLPMALLLNIDLLGGIITYNAPSSQWWFQLAYTLIGGMGFASIVTLIITPSLLVLFQKK